MNYVLHKWSAGWGLPSLSVGCIQVEAVLRFAGLNVYAQHSRLPGSSPTGQFPALEHDNDLVGAPVGTGDEGEFDAMRAVMEYIKGQGEDVDGHLTNAQRGELAGMVALVQVALEPATLYTTWIEPEGFKKYQKAYSGVLPWPLDHVVAWETRRAVVKKLEGISPQKIFEEAVAAIESIADFIEGQQSKGSYCFGDQPSSLDALMYGHLQYYRMAPVAAPILQRKVTANASLLRYLDSISSRFFQEEASPPPPRIIPEEADEEILSRWSMAAQGRRSDVPQSSDEGGRENVHLKKTAKWWLAFAGIMMAAYAFYHPPPIRVQYTDAMLDDDEDDDVDS
ncbi:unnamed protein product [Ostreobium quekettii]|uniref:Metaxin n=1 Tax=Ostreobium quekettii TaxID=121088 RepID=A0A8S1J5Q1_9CHLO|nr:unnamed protein product [Ostreobium quekettii]